MVFLSIPSSYSSFPSQYFSVISKSENNMKTTFDLRDFALASADTFDQKQVLLVIANSTEVPTQFQSSFLKKTLDSSKLPDAKTLVIE